MPTTRGRRRQRAPSARGSGRRLITSRKVFLFGGGVVGILLAAVVVASLMGRSAGADADGGALRIPSFAYNSAMTLAGYKVARRMPEVLEVMPCYCGCGPGQGHVSLKDCFLRPDGAFDDHASNCHLCVEEAVDAGKWRDDGLGLGAIRAWTESKYSGHGPGTNTPPVN